MNFSRSIYLSHVLNISNQILVWINFESTIRKISKSVKSVRTNPQKNNNNNNNKNNKK